MAVAWKEIAIAYYIIGKWGMGNGEWGMGHGEWGMGNGEWGMGNGEWGMVRKSAPSLCTRLPHGETTADASSLATERTASPRPRWLTVRGLSAPSATGSPVGGMGNGEWGMGNGEEKVEGKR